MLRRFFNDVAVYGLSTILARSIALLLLPILTRYLSPADYGVVEMLAVCFALANIVLPLEITQAVAIFYSESKTPSERERYAWTAFWFTASVFAAFTMVVWAIPGPIAQAVLGSEEYAPVARLAAIGIAGQALVYVVQSQLRWSLQPIALSVVNISLAAMTALCTIALVIGLGHGLLGYLVAQITASFTVLALGVWLLSRRIAIRWRIDVETLRRMLAFSWPLVLSGVAVYANGYIDRWLVKSWLGLDDLGIYGVGYRLAALVGVAIIGFQLALTPLVFHHHAEPETPRFVKRALEYFLALVLPGVVFLAAFAPEIVRLVAGAAFASAADVLGWLALGVVIMNIYVFAPGLNIAKKTKQIALVNIAAGAANTILALLTIPTLGRLGAALAFVAGASSMAALYFALGRRHYPVPYRLAHYVAALAITAGFLAMMAAGHWALEWRAVLFVLASMIVALTITDRDERKVVAVRLSALMGRRAGGG